jgi:hypothetical protein
MSPLPYSFSYVARIIKSGDVSRKWASAWLDATGSKLTDDSATEIADNLKPVLAFGVRSVRGSLTADRRVRAVR